jgi:hypothetical protein
MLITSDIETKLSVRINVRMEHIRQGGALSYLLSPAKTCPDEGHSPLYEPESASEADRSQHFALPEISADIAEMSEMYQFALGFEPDEPEDL